MDWRSCDQYHCNNYVNIYLNIRYDTDTTYYFTCMHAVYVHIQKLLSERLNIDPCKHDCPLTILPVNTFYKESGPVNTESASEME